MTIATNDRRGFLKSATQIAMCGGLAAGYGTFAVLAGRFLYPGEDRSRLWQFVACIDELTIGESLQYVAPDGSRIVVTRHSDGDSEEAFIALSSVCPHLGCQVHWEANHQRFFCPCHNGAFDASGEAIAGPPQKAGQRLPRFPLMIRDGLLYIQVVSQQLVDSVGS